MQIQNNRVIGFKSLSFIRIISPNLLCWVGSATAVIINDKKIAIIFVGNLCFFHFYSFRNVCKISCSTDLMSASGALGTAKEQRERAVYGVI